MVRLTPLLTSTISSCPSILRQTSPEPSRKYQISSTVLCRTARETPPCGSVQWHSPPPLTLGSSRISDPSGAISSRLALNSFVSNLMMALLRCVVSVVTDQNHHRRNL